MPKTNFIEFAREISLRRGYPGLAPVIEKELLHYEVLSALKESQVLDRTTFQGGTCLRLCYGGERFSEDLDFAANLTDPDFPTIHDVRDT